jgi:hypothetical protein
MCLNRDPVKWRWEAELGAEHIEMPATSEHIWRAIHDARLRRAAGQPAMVS